MILMWKYRGRRITAIKSMEECTVYGVSYILYIGYIYIIHTHRSSFTLSLFVFCVPSVFGVCIIFLGVSDFEYADQNMNNSHKI